MEDRSGGVATMAGGTGDVGHRVIRAPSLAASELRTPHGYVDNLLMTGRGDIALVETKLFGTPQARRKVLAQVLDYAVGVFAMTYTEFERAVLASNF